MLAAHAGADRTAKGVRDKLVELGAMWLCVITDHATAFAYGTWHMPTAMRCWLHMQDISLWPASVTIM